MPRLVHTLELVSGETRTWEHDEGTTGFYIVEPGAAFLRLRSAGRSKGEWHVDRIPWSQIVRYTTSRVRSNSRTRG